MKSPKCGRCRDTGRLHLRTLPDGTRVHSDFLDCAYCGKADELVAAERRVRIATEPPMRADALYPGYRVPR